MIIQIDLIFIVSYSMTQFFMDSDSLCMVGIISYRLFSSEPAKPNNSLVSDVNPLNNSNTFWSIPTKGVEEFAIFYVTFLKINYLIIMDAHKGTIVSYMITPNSLPNASLRYIYTYQNRIINIGTKKIIIPIKGFSNSKTLTTIYGAKGVTVIREQNVKVAGFKVFAKINEASPSQLDVITNWNNEQ